MMRKQDRDERGDRGDRGPRGGGGFREAGQDLDPQTAGGQGLQTVKSVLVEIDRRGARVDPRRFRGQSMLADLNDQRAVGEEDHRAFGFGITAERHGVETQSRVLIEPHRVAVGEHDFHPTLAGGVHPVARHQRHVDDGLNGFFRIGGQHRGVPFEVRDVAQRGQVVLVRGHNHTTYCQDHANDQDLLHGPPPCRRTRVQRLCQ